MDLQRTFQKLFTGGHVKLYKLSGGKLGGSVFGVENVLLTTTGRKSGQPRVTPLVATPQGDRVVLIASNGGAPKHPDWYLNLSANPDVTLQRGSEVVPMRARVATGEERADLWADAVKVYKGYDGYQRKTEREIPIVVLERRP